MNHNLINNVLCVRHFVFDCEEFLFAFLHLYHALFPYLSVRAFVSSSLFLCVRVQTLSVMNFTIVNSNKRIRCSIVTIANDDRDIKRIVALCAERAKVIERSLACSRLPYKK